MIQRTLMTIETMSFPAKIFALAIGFLSPLSALIHVILALLLVDMITSIYYQMKLAVEKAERGKRTWAAFKVVESAKLRKTIEKMFFYVVVIIVFYSFDLVLLKIQPLNEDSIVTVSITNLSAVLIALVEMTSIASNVSKITGNPIFNKITSIFSKKVNKKFEIDEE
ncbi:MAG: phage holin family protein [Bacteroidales bacterium]|nr:phage holin family protein [Bacteroidales bacterium]